MQKPEIVERLNIDGSHKYWELLDPETGGILWREFTVTGADLSVYGRSIVDRGITIDPDGIVHATEFERPKYAIICESPTEQQVTEIKEALKIYDKELPRGILLVGCNGPAPFGIGSASVVREHLSSLEDFKYSELKEVPKLEETRKSYGEPPWKFNKPFNHKSQNYVKSNNRNRTARKR